MKKNQKTRRANTLFTLAALLVVLMSNVYVGRAIEPDPRILWVADSSIGIIHGFAVHPNGNVFAYRNNSIYEIDGKTGKMLKNFFVPHKFNKIESTDISDDGKSLVTAYDEVIITDLITMQFKIVGFGNRVLYLPNSSKIAYAAITTQPSSKGHDSSIVILDKETGERRYIKTEEMITNIAFSPDGKYMATAGVKEKSDGHYNTVFKIWDAQKLTFIKELKSYDSNIDIAEIYFSPNDDLLAFMGVQGLTIFNIRDYSIIDNIPLNFYGEIGEFITSFSFLNNEELIIQTQKINLYNLITKEKKQLFDFYNYGKLKFTPLKDKLMVLTHYRKENLGPITALDLDKLLTNIEEKISNDFIVHYDNFVLKIIGLETINTNFKIEIFDIKGNFIKQLDMPIENKELSPNLSFFYVI